MNEHQIQRSDRPEESGLVTAISVVGTVFGVIGMLGSFIPCFGMLALYVAIPAALISGVALGLAYYQKVRKTFAIVALTISMIGVTVAGIQVGSLASTGMGVYKGFEQEQRAREKAIQERQKKLEKSRDAAEEKTP